MGWMDSDCMDSKTRKRLHAEGERVRGDDRESGIWVAPKTRWYGWTDGSSVYLKKGSRLSATWKFCRHGWELATLDTDVILPPSHRAWSLPLWWYVLAVPCVLVALALLVGA